MKWLVLFFYHLVKIKKTILFWYIFIRQKWNILLVECAKSLTIYLFHLLLQGYEMKVYVLSALNLAIFPVLYFFTFLYYTDSGSTFFVLLMYYLHLRHSFFKAAIAGAISLFFRQTNIVWVFYVSIIVVNISVFFFFYSRLLSFQHSPL